MLVQTQQIDTAKVDIKSLSNFTTSETTMGEWSRLTAAATAADYTVRVLSQKKTNYRTSPAHLFPSLIQASVAHLSS
jgi:hypothetical protein